MTPKNKALGGHSLVRGFMNLAILVLWLHPASFVPSWRTRTCVLAFGFHFPIQGAGLLLRLGFGDSKCRLETGPGDLSNLGVRSWRRPTKNRRSFWFASHFRPFCIEHGTAYLVDCPHIFLGSIICVSSLPKKAVFAGRSFFPPVFFFWGGGVNKILAAAKPQSH